MQIVMKRSIVEGTRALDAGRIYDLLDNYAKRLIREGHAELLRADARKAKAET